MLQGLLKQYYRDIFMARNWVFSPKISKELMALGNGHIGTRLEVNSSVKTLKDYSFDWHFDYNIKRDPKVQPLSKSASNFSFIETLS